MAAADPAARAELEHERARAAGAPGHAERRPGAAVGLVQGAQRRGAAVEHVAAGRDGPGPAAEPPRPRPRAISTSASDAVEQLVAPLKEQLGRVDAQLLRLDQERRESRGRLEAQLRTLTDTGEQLADRDRRARHRAAQAQRARAVGPDAAAQRGRARRDGPPLRLRSSSRRCSGDDAVLRPDLIVHMPGGKHVVVDAKAPLQGVLDAYQARDEEERLAPPARPRPAAAQARQGAGRQGLLGRARLGARTSSCMFLPGEHLYGAALEADPTLIEDAMARRVLIATPTTLLAMLRAVALRLAAGARGRVGPGDLRARPRAARPAGQALEPALDARHAPQQRRPRLQRDGRLLRGPGAAGRAAVRRARRGRGGPRAARARAGHDQRPHGHVATCPTSRDEQLPRERTHGGCGPPS